LRLNDAGDVLSHSGEKLARKYSDADTLDLVIEGSDSSFGAACWWTALNASVGGGLQADRAERWGPST
jgi:hypothetical protein